MRRRTFAVLLLVLIIPVLARAQEDPELAERTIRFPDVASYHTVVADLHIHTVFSDGEVWPTIRVEEAVRDGLDAVAMTDHLEYQPHEEDIPHPNRNRSFQVASEAAADHDLIVINGSEITRDMPPGHSNAIFLENATTLLKDDPMAVFREAEQQGAFAFWNHPMWTAQKPNGIPELTDMHRRLIEEGLLEGIEVVNYHTYSREALRIALDHDLTILGTSDIHGLVDWDFEVPSGGHRPVTLVFAEERSKSGIEAALREGRTAAWFRNTLIGREAHLMPLLEASVSVARASYQEETAVLDVAIANRSEAEFILDTRSEYPYHARADVVRLAPHDTTTVQVKPGRRVESLELRFGVLNAVVAPDEHPELSLEVTPD